jgi:hypothetical protein
MPPSKSARPGVVVQTGRGYHAFNQGRGTIAGVMMAATWSTPAIASHNAPTPRLLHEATAPLDQGSGSWFVIRCQKKTIPVHRAAHGLRCALQRCPPG